jgi:hypothetical protein
MTNGAVEVSLLPFAVALHSSCQSR